MGFFNSSIRINKYKVLLKVAIYVKPVYNSIVIFKTLEFK